MLLWGGGEQEKNLQNLDEFLFSTPKALSVLDLYLPGGPVVKNWPANAGEHRFDPWSSKIQHASGQLSPCATIRVHALEPMLYSKRSHHNGKPEHHT